MPDTATQEFDEFATTSQDLLPSDLMFAEAPQPPTLPLNPTDDGSHSLPHATQPLGNSFIAQQLQRPIQGMQLTATTSMGYDGCHHNQGGFIGGSQSTTTTSMDHNQGGFIAQHSKPHPTVTNSMDITMDVAVETPAAAFPAHAPTILQGVEDTALQMYEVRTSRKYTPQKLAAGSVATNAACGDENLQVSRQSKQPAEGVAFTLEAEELFQGSESAAAIRPASSIVASASTTIPDNLSKVSLSNEWSVSCVEARAFTFAPSISAVLVAQQTNVEGCAKPQYGFKKVSLLNPQHTTHNDLHTKKINDIRMDSRNELVLTASMDKTLKVTSASTMQKVAEVKLDHPCWSCSWDPLNPNYFVCGLARGFVNLFDLRKNNGKPLMEQQLAMKGPVHSVFMVGGQQRQESSSSAASAPSFSGASSVLGAQTQGLFTWNLDPQMGPNGRLTSVESTSLSSFNSIFYDHEIQQCVASAKGVHSHNLAHPCHSSWLSTISPPSIVQRFQPEKAECCLLTNMQDYSRNEGSAICRPFMWASRDQPRSVFVASGNDTGNKLCVWGARSGMMLRKDGSDHVIYHTEPIVDVRGCSSNGATLLGSLSKAELKWGEVQVS
jgi:hypothetical protein